MKRLILALGLLFATSAYAADNTVILTPGVGVTMKSLDVGAGVQAMQPRSVMSTTAGVAIYGTAGTANANVLTVQGVTAMTPLDVNVISSVGVAQGSTSSGQTLAPIGCRTLTSVPTDTTAQTNMPWCRTNGTQAVDLYSFNGTLLSATNPLPVVTNPASADPCLTTAATILPFTIPTATTTNVLAGTAATKIYVCYLYMQTGLANNVAVISGTTGGTCGANTAALVGGVTAATGLLNAANSGQAFSSGGSTVLKVATANDDICMITSAAGPLAGVLKYVKAP